MRLPLAQNCHKRVEIFDKKPIHDGINLEMCVQKILSCHAIEEQFKKWLISQIKRQKERSE